MYLDKSKSEHFRRVDDYDDWTARSQMPSEEKARLERFILSSDESAQRYFDMDYILLKGRKG